MAFPAINWTKVRTDFDTMIEANGQTVDVKLRDGTTFQIKGVMRKVEPIQNLTDGTQQENDRLSIMYDRWHTGAGAGRTPEKGDQVTINGRRQAIDAVNTVGAGGILIGYNLRLRG